MRVLIVTGGSFTGNSTVPAYRYDGIYDRIIAADSGLMHCEKHGIVPTDILGDFDSLKNRELLDRYVKAGIPVRTFPTRKDYTDTELALQYAVDLGAEEIVLYGATGSRYDHTFANIALLLPLARQGIRGVMVDANNIMEIVIGPATREYKRNESKPFFSMLSLTPSCKDITLTGFSYPLEHYTLDSCRSLGISNEITEDKACLTFAEGILLLIQAED